jgi:hypothetical protein
MLEFIPRWVEILLMFSGAATVFVPALQSTVDPLREWARTTSNVTDNKAVEVFARCVGASAAVLQAVKYVLAIAAARPKDRRPAAQE